MPSDTGLYIKHLTPGEIQSVRVVDANGIEYSMDIEQYKQRGIQPPIEKLKTETSKPIFRWITLASLPVALVITVLSVLSDCPGVDNRSEQCTWSKSLSPLTAVLFFFYTWPVLLVIGYIGWGYTKPNPSFERDAAKARRPSTLR